MAKIVSGSLGVVKPDVQEFYNEEHDPKDGRFTSGPGGSRGWKDAEFDGKKIPAEKMREAFEKATKDLVTPEQRKAERNAKIKKALLIAGGVALVAGAVFLGVKIHTDQQKAVADTEARAKQYELRSEKNDTLSPGMMKAMGRRRVHLTRRWEGVDKHGRKIRVIDTSGKMTDKEAKTMLDHLRQANDDAGLDGKPAALHVHGDHSTARGAFGFVTTRPGTRVINMNHDRVFGQSWSARLARFAGRSNKAAFSPVFHDKSAKHKGELARYTISHEMGHVIDMNESKKAGGGRHVTPKSPYRRAQGVSVESKHYAAKRKSVFSRWRSPGDMSSYGQSNEFEGYAESYAEWTLTGGKTKSRSARDYARSFGWKNYS